MKPQIVINASPLIAFARMGALNVIGQLPSLDASNNEPTCAQYYPHY
jgi:hypothetical protein